MTEHALYSSADALPVHVPQRARFSPASALRDPDRAAPAFSRSGSWTFRSIRRADTRLMPPVEPLVLTSGNRIHLSPAEPQLAVAQSGLGGIGSDAAPAPGARVTALDIYTGHFGLAARPFTLVPDPDFLFWSSAHQHAYAALEYGVLTHAPITLITGEIGAGKTTLLHQLLNTIGSGVTIGLISNTMGAPEDLLRWVLLSLGQPTPADASYPGLVAALQDHLIAEYACGNRVILVFDEAQNLTADGLEELRMLTNINAGKDNLLQLVLVGQPELRDLVSRPGLHQFAQRVAASFHLTAMDAATVRAYVAHRLRVAGVKSNLFSEAATSLIHQATGGIPRRVNQLCDLAMVYAYTRGQQGVVRFTVQQVLDDGVFFGASLGGMAVTGPLQ